MDPQIISGIIGGVAAIIVAIIGLVKLKPRKVPPADPFKDTKDQTARVTNIHAEIVHYTEGNVTNPRQEKSIVSQGIPIPKAFFPICNLPRRNIHFTGRDALLETLRQSFKNGHNIALTQQALYGLGGIGKSQLALEYAWRHSGAYEVIWWLHAEEPTTLASEYAALAAELDLPEQEAQEQAVTVRAVNNWLNHHGDWLLIFDNARDPESIRSYLPDGTGGHVLITSRSQHWNTIGTPLQIEVWSRNEAIAFLNKRTGRSDDSGAGDLAETLGFLPLALEQAAAYCLKRTKSYADYRDLFNTRRAELWKREQQPDNYPDTVATTWSLAFQEVEKTAFATDLLNLCSMVAPDAIPRSLMSGALGHYAATEGEAQSIDALLLDDAIEALGAYSLITAEEQQLSIHRLVQTVAQDRMLPEAQESCRRAALQALSEQFPSEGYNNPACWPVCATLMPHAELLVTAIADDTPAGNELSLLLNNMGLYLHGRAAYAEAEQLSRRSLAIYEKALGKDHPSVASSLNNLAGLLQDQGKYAEAEPLHRRALAIDETALGPDHPSVANSLNNLAN